MLTRIFSFVTLTLLSAPAIFAQAGQPAPLYTGSLGGGIALTGGNTDTKNFNLTFNMIRDPKTKNVIKADAAYLRGNQSDILNLDRAAVAARDEYTVSDRTFVFGQLDYLRDRFKEIIFLWAPVGGVGYKLVNTDSTKFQVDGGAGGVLERNPGRDTSTSGSLKAGQNLQLRLTPAVVFIESSSTLWKTNEFGDSLTNFNVGLTTSLTSKLELKIGFIDSYKNKPPTASVKKNDTAFVTNFVLKF